MAMRAKPSGTSINDLFRDGRAIDAAAKRAVRLAVAEIERESGGTARKKKTAKAKRVNVSARPKAVRGGPTAVSKSRSASKRRAA